MPDLRERLKSDRLLLLDGATGTELQRRGLKLPAPLWSTVALLSRESRGSLQQIHTEYIQAGADVITANTFRTNHLALAQEGMQSQARHLTHTAIDTVRAAIDDARTDHDVWIAGSIAPVADCYAPQDRPEMNIVQDNQKRLINDLFEGKVDALLVETMNNREEAVSAVGYAAETDLPIFVSLLTDGREKLYDETELGPLVSDLMEHSPSAIMLNCVTVEALGPGLEKLRSSHADPLGFYANMGDPQSPHEEPIHMAVTPEDYRRAVADLMMDYKVVIIGGCCGSRHEHIRELHDWRQTL